MENMKETFKEELQKKKKKKAIKEVM